MWLTQRVCKYVYDLQMCVITSVSTCARTQTHKYSECILTAVWGHIVSLLATYTDTCHRSSAAYSVTMWKMAFFSVYTIYISFLLNLPYIKSWWQTFNILEPKLSAEEMFRKCLFFLNIRATSTLNSAHPTYTHTTTFFVHIVNVVSPNSFSPDVFVNNLTNLSK